MGPGACRCPSATSARSRAASDRASRVASSTSSTRPATPHHHVVYFDGSDGTAYVGDVAGVRIPPSDFVRPPTPPPDIDVEQWQRSIDLVGEREPERLALTHFGAVEEPGPHLEQTRTRLDEQAELVRRLLDEHGDTPEAVEAFVEEMHRRAAEASRDGSAAVLEVGAPIEQTWTGMRRYWLKRAEAVRPASREPGRDRTASSPPP